MPGEKFTLDIRPTFVDARTCRSFLATTSCLCELTEKSAGNRSGALDVPDFTRGAWKTARKMDVVDIDLVHFGV